jgi:hypothetical protein
MTTNRKRIGLRLFAALRHWRSGNVRSVVAIIAKGLCFGLLTAGFTSHQAATALSAIEPRPVVADRSKQADFEQERASREARQVADWVVNSGDNHRMPFVIVDKTDAKVFVFHADGRLRGAAPALLGMARGDDAVPGIGDRKISSIRTEERTTPAGRFVAALDRNLRGEEILWVDYATAISMHRVHANKPKERRLQRLATPTPLDNRISYGCINVPAKFYDNVVRPAFNGTNGIVYVLPETRLAREVFLFPEQFDKVE